MILLPLAVVCQIVLACLKGLLLRLDTRWKLQQFRFQLHAGIHQLSLQCQQSGKFVGGLDPLLDYWVPYSQCLYLGVVQYGALNIRTAADCEGTGKQPGDNAAWFLKAATSMRQSCPL